MGKEKRSKKKNGGKIVFLLIIIIIAVAAVLVFVKGGFGSGGQGGDDMPAMGTMPDPSRVQTVPETSAAQDETENGSDGQQRVIIEVDEDKILANGSVCSDAAALKEYLLGAMGDDTEFTLTDSHAVKSVYDDAKSVLDELGIEYSEDVINENFGQNG